MKGIWSWFRGLPIWGQVVGWTVAAIVVLGALGAAVGEDPESGQPGESESGAQAEQTETGATKADVDDEEHGESESDPKGDPKVDEDTRHYLDQMSTCRTAVGLVILEARGGNNTTDIELADSTTQARDVCDDIRTELALADTDHFDDQAATGFYGIDLLKSGLNAMLAYIDNPRPSKLVEARDKIREGDQAAAQAQRQINQRRNVYNLRPYRP